MSDYVLGRIEQLAATNEELSNCVAVLEQQLRISETIREAVSEGRDKTFARMQARIEELQRERDEALNQLDSARHSVDVLLKRVAELKGEDRG